MKRKLNFKNWINLVIWYDQQQQLKQDKQVAIRLCNALYFFIIGCKSAHIFIKWEMQMAKEVIYIVLFQFNVCVKIGIQLWKLFNRKCKLFPCKKIHTVLLERKTILRCTSAVQSVLFLRNELHFQKNKTKFSSFIVYPLEH